MTDLSPPRIVCAANKHKGSGEIAIGIRHFCPLMYLNIHMMCKAKGIDIGDFSDAYAMGWRTSEQGFVDQHGAFYSRKAAWMVANTNGQIFRDRGWQTGTLHSEHLY